jgi:hypothetical protein
LHATQGGADTGFGLSKRARKIHRQCTALRMSKHTA